MVQNVLEYQVINLFNNRPEKFERALEYLYEKTHLIGPVDDNYEWCMVVTKNGQLKNYEQLAYVSELKGRTNIIEYEYEIVGQKYVNILEKEDYNKVIIERLHEKGIIDGFINWINLNKDIQKLVIHDIEALRFRKVEEILKLLNLWNPLIYKEIKEYIYSVNKNRHKNSWINRYMNRIKLEISDLQKDDKVYEI